MFPFVPFLRRRLLAPFRVAGVPRGELSRGAGLGLGVALLPILGQLYLTPALWAAARPLARMRFNLPVAMAMVLLINPPLKVPLFYFYLLSGEALLSLAGMSPGSGADAFRAAMDGLSAAPWPERWGAAGRLLGLALERYALPLGVGGLAWAVAAGLAVWGGVTWALTRRGESGNTGEPAE